MKNTKIRRNFITGIIVLLPIIITINVLFLMVRFADNILGRYINPYVVNFLGFPIFGLGLLTILILIFVTGFFTTNVFFKNVMPYFEALLLRIPFFYQIYPSVKQLVQFVFSEEKLAFKKVVIFEYPKVGVFSMGYVTNNFTSEDAQGHKVDMVVVLVPTVPNPVTGVFVIVPKDAVKMLDLSIEESFKIIISGGVLMQGALLNGKIPPEKLTQKF